MKRTKVFLIVALLCAVVQGAWAQFNVTKDATMSEDWTVTPENPVTTGQTVTATYTGSKHVKSVKFVKKMRQATGKSSKTDWQVGDIICSNGMAYTINAYTTIPAGVTPTAIIAYKGSATGDADYKNGLAFALKDVDPSGDTGGYVLAWKNAAGTSDNSTKITQEYPTTAESGRALTTDGARNQTGSTGRLTWPAFNYAARYTVARPSVASVWFLPSIYQWNLMVKTLLGVSSNLGFTANADMNWENINAKLQTAIDDTNVKAVALANAPYWTASEYNTNQARCYRAGGQAGYGSKTDTYRVRPIIAF